MLKLGDLTFTRVNPEKLNGKGAAKAFEAEEYDVPFTKPMMLKMELSPSLSTKFPVELMVKMFVLLL
jgi:hypothetical protein